MFKITEVRHDRIIAGGIKGYTLKCLTDLDGKKMQELIARLEAEADRFVVEVMAKAEQATT